MNIKASKNKVAGELAVRGLSDKARKFYNDADPLEVYEYQDDDGNKLYAYDGAYGYSDGLTFSELEEYFEALQGEIDNEVDD